MSETTLRHEIRTEKYIASNLGDRGHFSSIEAHTSCPGVPDLSYTMAGTTGWLELKYGTPSNAPHLRPMQFVWIRKNVAADGHPLILVLMENTKATHFRQYGLFHGDRAPRVYQTTGLDPWQDACQVVWDKKINWGEFLHYLKKPHELAKGG